MTIDDLEARVTDALRADAEAAPPALGLLGAVQRRARRRSLQHRALVAAAAVTVSGGVGAAWSGLAPRDGLTTEAPAADGPVLEDGALPPQEFPLTATWLPEGLGAPRYDVGAAHALAEVPDRGRPASTALEFGAHDDDAGDRFRDLQRTPTAVAGRPGFVTRSERYVLLVWQVAPDRWLSAAGRDAWADEAVVRRVAEGLEERATAVVLPFQVSRLPRGSAVTDWSTEGAFGLSAPDGWVAVRAKPGRHLPSWVTGGERVDVAGETGYLVPASAERADDGALRREQGWVLVVAQPRDVALEVRVPAWPREDVIEFAAAIRFDGSRELLTG